MSINDYVDKPIGTTIAKIAFGAIFFAVGAIPDPELSDGGHAMGIIIGLALIAWGVLPYIIAWREMKEDERNFQKAEEARRAEQERLANVPKKCPNCGATTHGTACEYCGAPLQQ